MPSLNIVLKLQRIICYDEDDGTGNAEPYLWTIFFKIDSDKAALKIRQDASPPITASSFFVDGTATIQTSTGSHGNLGANDTWEGRDIAIPSGVGEFKAKLNPLSVPGFESFGSGGAVGCLVLLLEEDGSIDAAVESGHIKLNEKFEEVLNQILPDLDLAQPNITQAQKDSAKDTLKKAIEDEIWKNTALWQLFWPGTWDSDDQIGFELFTFTLADLVNAGTDGITFGGKWDKEGSWEIQGKVIASADKEPSVPSTIPTNPGTCFIATAAAGSVNDPAVMRLREFRDRFLRNYLLGRMFINVYEIVGPYAANAISKSYLMRRVIYKLVVQPAATMTYFIRLEK